MAAFLPTKLTVPGVAPGIIPRARLFDALDAATQGPLTLVAGPAGIGKTALVASWVASGRAPGAVAWLSLDATDDTRPRFWRLMLSALSEADAGSRPLGERFVVRSEQTVDAVLPQLLALLAQMTQPIVLVLDDFDEITDPAILADLELLLRTPPPALRLVVTARRAPALRLQRLRLAGAVLEIEPGQLAFSQDEAALVLESAGVQLSDDDVSVLWERTEGWAAGLRLTAMALRTHPDHSAFVAQFAGDEAPIADYLLEEILSMQPPHIRDFLLRTSITDTINGELADVLTGQNGGGSMLAALHQDGIMATALDDHREWFRYHGLFRGLLRSVLRREDPTVVPELHRRAAVWMMASGRDVEAARHALAAQDWVLLSDIVAGASFSLLVRGELNELATVLRLVPPARLRTNPALPLAIAGGALEVGDGTDAEAWIQLADAHAYDTRPQDREMFALGRAIIGLYRGRLTGDVAGALEDALPLMGGDRGTALDHFGPAGDLRALALVNLGAVELWTGHLEDAQRDLEAGTAAAIAGNLTYLELYGRAHLAVYHLWHGDLREADEQSAAAMALAEQHGWRSTTRASVALAVRGTLALTRGDLEEADTCLAAAGRAVARSVERPLRANVAANAARLLRLQGRPADALSALDEVRADLEGTPFWAPIRASVVTQEAICLHELGSVVEATVLLEAEVAEGVGGVAAIGLAQLRLNAGHPEAALELIDGAAFGIEGPMQAPAAVWALIVRAAAERALGQHDAADDAFDAAVDHAAAHSCWIPFLRPTTPLADRLGTYVRTGGEHAALVSGLLDRVAAGPTEEHRVAVATAQAVAEREAESLSERELAVLRYLPTAMTNREIAGELFVSVNTVKTHLKQIYRKLDAHDRREAVTCARRLGLLAPPSSRG